MTIDDRQLESHARQYIERVQRLEGVTARVPAEVIEKAVQQTAAAARKIVRATAGRAPDTQQF